MSSIFRILSSNINLSELTKKPNELVILDKSNRQTKSTKQTNLTNPTNLTNNPFVLPTQSKSSKSKTKSKSKSIPTNSEKIVESVKQVNPVNPVNPVQTNTQVDEQVEIEEKKIYWEYGNSGLKTKEFGKKMNRNLAILYYIDKIFLSYAELPDSSIVELFNPDPTKSELPIEINFGTNKINSNDKNIPANTVNVTLDCGKISGTYNVKSVGFTFISDVKITESDLIKKKIPFFESFINRLDNLKEIIKITNILSLQNKFKVESYSSSQNLDGQFNFSRIFENFCEIKQKLVEEGKEKKILKSSNDSAFYIKIYEDYAKAFCIDKSNNLIYYMSVNEDYKKGKIFIRYYSINIDDSLKIKSI